MNAETYEALKPLVHRAAHAAARRCRGATVEDLVQAGWMALLEAMPRFRPAKGERDHYASKILRRVLREESRREVLPAHFPQRREPHPAGIRVDGEAAELAFDRRQHAVVAQQDDREAPLRALQSARVTEAVRSAVDRVCGTRSEFRAVCLGEQKPAQLAAAFGRTPRYWQTQTSRVYAQLREEIDPSLLEEVRP